ncbi:MAG: HAD family phosphatase [Candidatus Aenigmarchaeota archaeon]|nr:HAD family phosphatase [Candidatus Aenigmarchaeota archaeon]
MIKAILFDLGGVFASDPLPLTCRRLSKITGIKFNKIYKIAKQNHDPIQRGKITIGKYWENVRRDLKSGFDINEAQEMYLKFLKPYRRMITLIKKLRKEYKVGLLSNTEKENFLYWKKKYYFNKIFDVIITSFEISSRKPERKIYKKAIEKLACRPNEIIFVDNESKNLKTAASLGMRTIHYVSHENFLKELNRLL